MKKFNLLVLVSILFVSNTLAQSNEGLKFSLGASGAGVVYNTYLYLEQLHQGYLNGCNSAEVVSNAAEGQVGLLEVVEKGYADLKESEELTDPSDQFFVQRLAEITSLLRDQAIELKNISTIGDEASKNAYQKTKDAAWIRISDLLQLGQQ